MIWSALSLAAALLLCAALVLGPLVKGPRPPRLAHGAKVIELRAKGSERMTATSKAVDPGSLKDALAKAH